MLAFLSQIGQRKRFRDVFAGIWSAILISLMGGIVVFFTLRNYDGSTLQAKIEGITYLIACLVLTYMTFWMKKQGSNIKGELHAKLQAAITTGSIVSIAFIAFITVGRESLETVVFMIAIAFHSNPVLLGIGACVGIIAGLVLSYMIYVLGKKINLKHFFDIMGTLLMLFAAGLLADGIEAFQEIGWLPGQHSLWNTATVLSENSTLGDIMHSFFGYADSPTSLQVILYIGYLLIALYFFWRSVKSSARRQASVPE